jgi:hypothetical protein
LSTALKYMYSRQEKNNFKYYPTYLLDSTIYLSKNFKAKIIMIGDFNLHLQSITKYLEPIGSKGALSIGIATNSLGNQIDQIFSNQPITFSKCKEVPFSTDHLVILAIILIKLSKDS